MFKSIQQKLTIYTLLLIIAVAGTTFFIIQTEYIYAFSFFLLFLLSIIQIYRYYNKINKNIFFLLNALDNGDYMFHFTTTKLPKREKELNEMMNRIKEIISKARQEVIEHERFLSHIVQSIPAGIIILDSKDNIKDSNHAASSLLGLPVLTHLNQLKVIDEELPEVFKSLKASDENRQIVISTEKEQKQISLGASNIQVNQQELRVITLYGIDSELEAKEMESWAKLIRIMTHEIMNSITPITSLTEMLLYSFQNQNDESQAIQRESTIDSLATIHSTAKDLTTFVNSYREFSRISTPQKTAIDLLPFIHSILKLESTIIDAKNIRTQIYSDREDITLYADRSQLSRVIVNLLKNAIEATTKEESPEIHIQIATLVDDRIKISFTNKGEAIPDDILDNIFIPFYTTKQDGSGIGLSVSRYILRLHGGSLKYSHTEGWTTFSIVI